MVRTKMRLRKSSVALVVLCFFLGLAKVSGQQSAVLDVCKVLNSASEYDSTIVRVRGYAMSDINASVLFEGRDYRRGINIRIEGEAIRNDPKIRAFFLDSFKASPGGPEIEATVTGIFHDTPADRYITIESVEYRKIPQETK